MLKNAIVAFDTSLTHTIQHWPSWLHAPMWLASTIGHPASLLAVAAAVAWYAWNNSKPAVTYSLAAASIAMGLNMVLKHYIHRPRPDTLYVSNMYFKTSSFPSGHAFSAMVMLGLVAYLALKYLPAPWNSIVAVASACFIFLIGVSRIYLGAHYPTDVIAGWVLGGVFLAIIILVFKP